MDDEFDGLAENLKQRSTWLRVFFMVGFCLALYVVGVVLFFITVAQALFSVVTGADNSNLRVLGANLTEYVNQILKFLTYNSQTRPFPFSPFPDSEEEPAAAVDDTLEPDTDIEDAPESSPAEGSDQGSDDERQPVADGAVPETDAEEPARPSSPDSGQAQ